MNCLYANAGKNKEGSFLRETCPQTFPLISCQYVRTIHEKINYMLPTFQKWTFYKGLYRENDGPSYEENSTRNIYSNYYQMRAYVECSLNQSKNYTLSTFPSSN